MTRITVHIEGENASEVHEALVGLASMRVEPKAEPTNVSETTLRERFMPEETPAETRIDPNKVPLPPEPVKATRAKAEPKAKATEADVFADQVKRATAEEQAADAAPKTEPQGEVTFKMVQDALAAYSSKNSMIKAREVLAGFKNAEGGPVARISELQAVDFSEAHAKLSA